MKKPALLILLLFGLLFSCSKSSTAPHDNIVCDGSPKSFSVDVNPIIQSICNQPQCHGPGSVNGPGSLTSYSEVFHARNAIRPAILSGLMPQNTTLTLAQKTAIICWIDSGAGDN